MELHGDVDVSLRIERVMYSLKKLFMGGLRVGFGTGSNGIGFFLTLDVVIDFSVILIGEAKKVFVFVVD